MAEVFLLPVAIKLAFFEGKCLEMDRRPKRSWFWSIADHFEATQKFHFTAPLTANSEISGNKTLKKLDVISQRVILKITLPKIGIYFHELQSTKQ